MKIVLIWPDLPKAINEYLMLPSLELCTLSALLKQNGNEVSLIDMRINKFSIHDLDRLVINAETEMYYIQGTIHNHCNVIEIAKRLKKLRPKSIIVLGGEVATFMPMDTLKRNKDIDYIVSYEPEFTMSELCETITSGKTIDNVKNITYRRDGEVVANQLIPPKYDLNMLPFPDREIYEIEKYLERDFETIVGSSRGCPGKCSFCIKTKLAPFRLFSISRFCDEIEYLMKMGFTSFFFADETFAFSDQRIQEFYDEVKKRNLKFKWACNMRIKDVNELKLSLMKEIGIYRVFVGLETINSKSSKLINKNLELEEIKNKVALVKKNDIEIHTSFIVGAPGDTEEDLESTIHFLNDIKPTLATFNSILVKPGTDIYKNPEAFDIIMDDRYWFEKEEWSMKNVMGTKSLPPEKVMAWRKKFATSMFFIENDNE